MLLPLIKLLKNKKRSETIPPPMLSAWFLKEVFLLLYSMNWSNFMVNQSLLREILGNMCIEIVCYSACDVINFEISPIFLIKPFLSNVFGQASVCHQIISFMKSAILDSLTIFFFYLCIKYIIRKFLLSDVDFFLISDIFTS